MSSSVCANDDCITGEELLPSIIVGVIESISSPNIKVISLFLNSNLNNYYHFTGYLLIFMYWRKESQNLCKESRYNIKSRRVML